MTHCIDVKTLLKPFTVIFLNVFLFFCEYPKGIPHFFELFVLSYVEKKIIRLSDKVIRLQYNQTLFNNTFILDYTFVIFSLEFLLLEVSIFIVLLLTNLELNNTY